MASSGETFTTLVRQVLGVTFLGENTMGCMTYGNASIVEHLSNSNIHVRFGFAGFFVTDVMSFHEGLGIFPNYWLDDIDPEEAIRHLLHGK